MNNLSVKYFHRICFCKVRLPSVITNDLVMICSLKKRLILGRTNRIDYFVPFWRLIMKYKLLITGKHICLFFLFGNTYFSFLLKDWKCCGLSSIFIWSKCFFNLYILIFVWLSKIWRFLEVQKNPQRNQTTSSKIESEYIVFSQLFPRTSLSKTDQKKAAIFKIKKPRK